MDPGEQIRDAFTDPSIVTPPHPAGRSEPPASDFLGFEDEGMWVSDKTLELVETKDFDVGSLPPQAPDVSRSVGEVSEKVINRRGFRSEGWIPALAEEDPRSSPEEPSLYDGGSGCRRRLASPEEPSLLDSSSGNRRRLLMSGDIEGPTSPRSPRKNLPPLSPSPLSPREIANRQGEPDPYKSMEGKGRPASMLGQRPIIKSAVTAPPAMGK